jgi:hypothetical protein
MQEWKRRARWLEALSRPNPIRRNVSVTGPEPRLDCLSLARSSKIQIADQSLVRGEVEDINGTFLFWVFFFFFFFFFWAASLKLADGGVQVEDQLCARMRPFAVISFWRL